MPYPHTHILIPITPDRRGRAQVAITSIHESTDPVLTPYTIHLYENDYIGYPNAIRDMVQDVDGYAYMGASDLVMFPGWLTTLWEEYEKIARKGFIEPFNEFHAGRLCQHPLGHTRDIKTYMVRDYFHYFADNEMDERIKAAGLYTYCPDAKIEHHHMINGKAPEDAGYRAVFNKERNDKDRETYLRRKANNWN